MSPAFPNQSVLTVEELQILYQNRNNFFSKRHVVSAVQGVTFNINQGETFALVGESGCGKSSIAMSILGFVRPANGQIKYKNLDLWGLRGSELRKVRYKLQPVFQDPHQALNPRMMAGRAVEDGLINKVKLSREKRKENVLKLFQAVGLREEHLYYYPHQLSGGQTQRVCIARALAPEPDLLILDEPISSQDLSIQARIINLLAAIKSEKQLSYLFISHNLKVIRSIAQRVAVMRNGTLLEVASTEKIFNRPEHPYTVSMLENAGIG